MPISIWEEKMRGIKKKEQLWQVNEVKEFSQERINDEIDSDRMDDYRDRVEHYAQQIRSTSDLSEIINYLDVALFETKNLHESNEIKRSRAQIQKTEQDIEELKKELEILSELVHTDQSTGASNRRGFDAAFIRESANADRNNISLCLILLELDDLKLFNDVYGNHLGDLALSHLVQITKKSLRPSDIISRFEKDKFVILLPNTTVELATLVTKRLQSNLMENHLEHDENSIPITFSAGVSTRSRYENQSSVIKRADRSLHLAKKSGAGKSHIVAVEY